MSRPLKRSRIVTDDVPSTATPLSILSSSHSSEYPTTETITTCTNNNARRIRAHAVTLRLSQQRDKRRQTQQSTHTTLQQQQHVMEGLEYGDIDMLVDEGTNENVNAEQGKHPDVPKERPVVRAISKQMQELLINF